jgi:hypothetical protein
MKMSEDIFAGVLVGVVIGVVSLGFIVGIIACCAEAQDKEAIKRNMKKKALNDLVDACHFTEVDAEKAKDSLLILFQ